MHLIPSNALAQFEIYCTYELLHLCVKGVFPSQLDEIHGHANLLKIFISNGLQIDLAVLLYEYIELLEQIAPEQALILKKDEDYRDLWQLRMNLHTYNKNGSYCKVAADIIDKQRKKFGLEERDALYILKNDISLFYEVNNDKLIFSGTNYYWFHTIHGIDQEKIQGKNLKNFTAKTASLLKGFRSAIDETMYNMPSLELNPNLPHILGVDYKSDDLFSRVPFAHAQTIRLLSVLTQLSYGIFLIDSLLDKKTINENNLWYCYFTKNITIKYDEAVDNICSMLNNGPLPERELLKKTLENHDLDVDNLLASRFVSELRNTIHYKKINLDKSHIGKTTASYIEAIYLSNTPVESMTDFRSWGKHVYLKAKQLQGAIQAVFNLNRSLWL